MNSGIKLDLMCNFIQEISICILSLYVIYYMLCSGLLGYISGIKIDILIFFTVPFFGTTFYST